MPNAALLTVLRPVDLADHNCLWSPALKHFPPGDNLFPGEREQLIVLAARRAAAC